MKKLLAFALAMVLVLSLAACGKPAEDGAQDSTTTVTTTTTAAGEDTTTTATTATTAGTVGSDTTATTVTTTTQEPTTSYVPGGATVPIGTRPPTTTTTKKPTATTTTTTQGDAPIDPTTTVTTTTTKKPTTTTSTTVKPTQPPVSGPYIALPEIGSDIDVTKKKNRIRVSAVAAWFNDNGNIGVSLTFKNYTTNWITEETDYVTYTCYDKDGRVVKRANLMIGVIDTKKHPVKEFVFEVPADTSEVRITKSKITYWTEWA